MILCIGCRNTHGQGPRWCTGTDSSHMKGEILPSGIKRVRRFCTPVLRKPGHPDAFSTWQSPIHSVLCNTWGTDHPEWVLHGFRLSTRRKWISYSNNQYWFPKVTWECSLSLLFPMLTKWCSLRSCKGRGETRWQVHLLTWFSAMCWRCVGRPPETKYGKEFAMGSGLHYCICARWLWKSARTFELKFPTRSRGSGRTGLIEQAVEVSCHDVSIAVLIW